MEDKRTLEEARDMLRALKYVIVTIPDIPESPRTGIALIIQFIIDKINKE